MAGYKHTGTDKDYDAYKEALNAATNEVRKSKRNFEHKLAPNIKSDSKSFYAYVRSKQNVRDKVGPLVDNAGNIITQGILMAEELNMHFSSVFTREDTSSIPVPETKFKGSEGERLGQLVVTPEVVVSKINNMKENKSPGVDGISPKILKETVEQISTPLAHVFTMSLKEGIVPFEWKEANIIPLFKKGSRNKSVNYRPVSLTSVICKLLETIIRDHIAAVAEWLALRTRRAGGREFEPRPGHYSRMSFSSGQVTGTVFPHLNMPFLPNSKFI